MNRRNFLKTSGLIVGLIAVNPFNLLNNTPLKPDSVHVKFVAEEVCFVYFVNGKRISSIKKDSVKNPFIRIAKR